MSDDVAPNTLTADETDDWPAKATQTVVGYVDTVRTATTGKALTASRAIVYFLAVGLIAFMLAVLLLIVLVRAVTSLTAYLSFIDTGEVWLAYLILGAIFLGVGGLLWRKKEG